MRRAKAKRVELNDGPRKSEAMKIRLEPDLKQHLEQIANAEQRTASAMARVLLWRAAEAYHNVPWLRGEGVLAKGWAVKYGENERPRPL